MPDEPHDTIEEAYASVVSRTASTMLASVVESGWSTLMPAATRVKVAILACSRLVARTRSVASVTMSTMPTIRSPSNSGAKTTSQNVSSPGIATRWAAWRITCPERTASTRGWMLSSLPGMRSWSDAPGVVYSGPTPR